MGTSQGKPGKEEMQMQEISREEIQAFYDGFPEDEIRDLRDRVAKFCRRAARRGSRRGVPGVGRRRAGAQGVQQSPNVRPLLAYGHARGPILRGALISGEAANSGEYFEFLEELKEAEAVT